MYIRRGDKEVENEGRPLVENLTDYFETAALLRSMANDKKVRSGKEKCSLYVPMCLCA